MQDSISSDFSYNNPDDISYDEMIRIAVERAEHPSQKWKRQKPCSKCNQNPRYKYAVWCLPCLNAYRKDQRKQGKGILTPDQQRDANYRYNYGITLDQYNWLLDCQGGVCAICGEHETRTLHGKVLPLSVDHCHKTNRVRALLCSACNQALGRMKEDPERIKKLLKYTKKWQDT